MKRLLPLFFLSALPLAAQVPQIINYQGRVAVGSTNFEGTGQFKFALVNAAGTTTYWSNNGSSVNGSEPSAFVSLTVTKGLYSVLLGDTSLSNMTAIPSSVFNNSDVRLRVWFNNGALGSQLLTPDQRLASVGYSMIAGTVPDNAITSSKIAAGAVTSTQVDSTTVQRRISGTAPSGSFITGVNLDGSVTVGAAPTGIWSLNGSNTYYNGGNVGIGTNTPAFKLHVSDLSGSVVRLDGPTPAIAFVDTAASNVSTFLRANAGGLRVLTNNNSNVIFDLKSTGFLGLGTTNPLSAVHINGNADALRLTGTKPFITLDDNGTYSRIESNGFGIDFRTYGNVLNGHPGGIHLDGTGTVGICTTTPKHQLSIRSFAGAPGWTSNGWNGAIDMDNSASIAWASNTGGQRFGMGHTNGAFLMWRTASDPGTTGSAATYDFAITDAGNFGFGTTAPAGKMHAVSAGGISAPQGQLTQTLGSDFARLRLNSGSSAAWDVAVGGPTNVMNFYATGTGKNVLSLNANGTVSVPILTITGGADVAEPFPMKEEEIEKGSVVVIDEEHPGHLKRSTSAYDRRVAGIVSGANGVRPGIALHQSGVLEGGDNVALSGRVYVNANTSGGSIEPGDMLTTSDVPGEAMKATDHNRAQGAILGKAMTGLTDSSGHVLVLVTLQ